MAKQKSELGPLTERVAVLVPRRRQHPGTGENQVQYVLWQRFWAEVISTSQGGETVENHMPVAMRGWRVRLRYHSRLIGPEAQSMVIRWGMWMMQVQKSDDFEGRKQFVWMSCEAME